MQKIIPNLWFDKNAQEAVDFYTAVFRDSEVLGVTHYTEAGHEIHGMEAGTVLAIEFQIEDHRFTALNGGPHFTPNPAISFIISRERKEDIDELWEQLAEGGTTLMPLDTYPFSERYGWVQDKFGFSWQLILPNKDGDWRPPLVPALLFVGENDGMAEEAMRFYTSIFPQSELGTLHHYGPGHELCKEGSLMYGDFQLCGQWFAAMDGGTVHDFTFNEAVSLSVTCQDQEELDRFHAALSAVPEAEQCGWLKDKYGVSWQLVPDGIEEMLGDPDKAKANRAMEAMLTMKKIDIAAMRAAYEGT